MLGFSAVLWIVELLSQHPCSIPYFTCDKPGNLAYNISYAFFFQFTLFKETILGSQSYRLLNIKYLAYKIRSISALYWLGILNWRLETMQAIFVFIAGIMGALGLMILFIGFLTTGATRHRVYRAWRARVGGRISCMIVSWYLFAMFHFFFLETEHVPTKRNH